MEQRSKQFSKEKLLLALIIGIGCYGFSLNFQPQKKGYQATQQLVDTHVLKGAFEEIAHLGPLQMEGTFLAGDPIRFTLKGKKFKQSDIEIDFGNGIQQSLSEPIFTYAYREQGQYELKIKQNGVVLFQTRLYITTSDQLVMN